MVNKHQIKKGREGMYLVLKSRALHWPTTDGKPRIWARAGQYVDLTSPFLCDLVQRTGQIHKLTKVEAVPADGVLISKADIPSEVRDRLNAYEAGRPVVKDAVAQAEADRKIDLDALPSAKKAAKATPELPLESGTAEKGSGSSSTGSGGKDD